MKKLVLIAAVSVFVLALSAQALAGWTASGAEPAIGKTSIQSGALSSSKDPLTEGSTVSFSGELDASGGFGKVKVSGEMAVTSVKPAQP